jgi:Leucine-rich repeat (LRR) protein
MFSIDVKYENQKEFTYKYFRHIPMYDYVVYISCHHNQLTKLPELPKLLQTLYCGYNKLTSLPKLPNSLHTLHCWNNKLTSLPKLPESLYLLSCNDNQLISLPNLPKSLESLYCGNNKLKSLPEFPKSLRIFEHNGNKLLVSYSRMFNMYTIWEGMFQNQYSRTNEYIYKNKDILKFNYILKIINH